MTVYMYSLSQRIYVDKRYDTCHHTKIIIIMLVLQVIFWRGNSKNSYDHDKNESCVHVCKTAYMW